MGLFLSLIAQRRSLRDAKSVLFVHYRKRQIRNLHTLLDQRLRSHQQIHVPLRSHPQNFFPNSRACAAGKQSRGKGTAHIGQVNRNHVILLYRVLEFVQQSSHRPEMLLRQYLGRGHQCRLQLCRRSGEHGR